MSLKRDEGVGEGKQAQPNLDEINKFEFDSMDLPLTLSD
jgi:hypothetical protein